MKAMISKKFAPIDQNPLELVELPIPEPGPEDILIQNKVCGVCHTDLHTVEGELPQVKLPIVPGHQVVGIVEKRGKNASRFKQGDRLGVAWLYSSCGQCGYCQRENENLCETARFTGYMSTADTLNTWSSQRNLPMPFLKFSLMRKLHLFFVPE